MCQCRVGNRTADHGVLHVHGMLHGCSSKVNLSASNGIFIIIIYTPVDLCEREHITGGGVVWHNYIIRSE